MHTSTCIGWAIHVAFRAIVFDRNLLICSYGVVAIASNIDEQFNRTEDYKSWNLLKMHSSTRFVFFLEILNETQIFIINKIIFNFQYIQ